jgi:hypothetical protein
MSELRDLTQALRSFDERLTSVEDCLVVLVRDSQQQTEWRHEQKNRAMIADGLKREDESAMRQVQDACVALSGRIVEVFERLDNQASLRRDDVKALNGRVGRVEEQLGLDEVTKT